jgi:hypothetical protein
MKLNLLFSNKHLPQNLKQSSFYYSGRIAAAFGNKPWIVRPFSAIITARMFLISLRNFQYFLRSKTPIKFLIEDFKDTRDWGLAIFHMQRNS